MLSLTEAARVYIAPGPTDLRRSIDGLCAIIQLQFELDPFCPCMFAFCNRARNRLKIIHWDHNGFWLYYRRLERGVFQWPGKDTEVTALSLREFRWLLDGLSTEQKKAHKPVLARIIM